MRLIVQTIDIFDFNEVEPTDIVHGPNNLTILQFDSFFKTLLAYYKLKSSDAVLFVEPDIIASTLKTSSPLQNEWGTQMMGANEYSSYLNRKNMTGRIIVAVLDTGVDANHSFLRSRMVRGWNFINGNNNPYDISGHGTHVAGIIVGATPNLNVMIMPVKVLSNAGFGTSLGVANGIVWAADSGANIINMSLGTPSHSRLSHIERNAINHAKSKNAVVVVAAGNEGDDARQRSWQSSPDVITVAAIDSRNRPAKFSNFGSVVDISAPGVDINSSVPGNRFSSKQGTSMAAPFVSAAVAMYLINSPELSSENVRTTIVNYVNTPNGWNIDRFGSGILDMRLAVTHPPPALHLITITPSPIQFAEISARYRNVTPHQITIHNISEECTGRVNIALTGEHARCFKLSQRRIKNIPSSESVTFTINPVLHLPAIQHDASLILTSEKFEETITVSFTVSERNKKTNY
jgi:hypothetical protein